jgi:hypothetical protein
MRGSPNLSIEEVAFTHLFILVDYDLGMLARHEEKIDANITLVRPVIAPHHHITASGPVLHAERHINDRYHGTQ